jgi:hypothetical protein
MSGKSPLGASDEQRGGLKRPTESAILFWLSGWKSTAIGDVVEMHEDTVRD